MSDDPLKDGLAQYSIAMNAERQRFAALAPAQRLVLLALVTAGRHAEAREHCRALGLVLHADMDLVGQLVAWARKQGSLSDAV